ncbi:MAG: SDR family oxidoreductase [Elusimicrobia bacterium]|nr:SDR family oxidoreductase [Elusimicrobiota bacterium]
MARNQQPPENWRLDGRVALITGGAGYLGRAMAEILCEAGAEVVLNGRDAKKLKRAADELRGLGGRVSIAARDVSTPKGAAALIADVQKLGGRLDILVNNAYGGSSSSVWEDFRKTYEVTVQASALLIDTALPMMTKAGKTNPGGACVVNIASMYGKVSPDLRIYGKSGCDNPPSYGPAKAALLQLTRYYACRLGPNNIRVNSISPGAFPPSSLLKAQPKFHEGLCRKTPLGRVGRPGELKGPLLFLASDASSYVTGADLAVDGGWTAW